MQTDNNQYTKMLIQNACNIGSVVQWKENR